MQPVPACAHRSIIAVPAKHGIQQQNSVTDGSPHRPGSILRARQRKNAGTAEHAYRRLNSHNRPEIAGIEDGAGGFGSHRHCAKITGDGYCGAGAGAAGRSGDIVRVQYLASA
ncbi:hypothetical protein D3C80_1280020 [compost metagenome]